MLTKNTRIKHQYNKWRADSMTEEKKEELEKAIKIIDRLNRAGIDYKICIDGSFDFHSDKDYERAQEIIKQIESKD
jgi:transcriptional regulator of NAD metabolism